MQPDLDQLIRSAKPEVPAGARARTLEHVKPEGAVGFTPAFVRVLLRVAALVLLAVCSGVVAAMLSAPKQQGPQPVDVAADIAQARTRLDSLEQNLLVNRVDNLKTEVAMLEADNQQALRQAITSTITHIQQARITEWRERHLQYVREHQAAERDATIEALRNELNLSTEQEQQVRALLVATDKKAEAVISEFYTTRRGHADPRMHEKFEKLADDAGQKLTALLDAQQRDKLDAPVDIVSSNPADYAPSYEFRDGTDVDVYSNWITVTRD